MKSFFIHTVPKLARTLTGGGNSPQLVDNSTEPLLRRLQTWVCRLSLVNLFSWLRELPNPRWSVGVGFLILSVYSFPLQAGTISTIAGGIDGFSGGDGGQRPVRNFGGPKKLLSIALATYILLTTNHMSPKRSFGFLN